MKRDIIDAALAFMFFSMGVLLLAVAYFLLLSTAHAEEPAYWPPCGTAEQDQRCPVTPPLCSEPGTEEVWIVWADSVTWECVRVTASGIVYGAKLRPPIALVRTSTSTAAPTRRTAPELQCSP